jgi:putative transport protein
MHWQAQLVTGTNVAGVLAGLSVAAAIGLALGGVRLKGFALGMSGVLFAAIVVSYAFWNEERVARVLGGTAAQVTAALERRRDMLELLREVGLVLFVYSVGLQIGPGFFSCLRAQGLRWNGAAAALVGLNVAAIAIAHRWLKVDGVAAVGLLSGAVTNTPGLAAAQQALGDASAGDIARHGLAAVGCAVAYPFGVVGPILSLTLLRLAFRLDPRREAETFETATRARSRALASIGLRVSNPALVGRRVGALGTLLGAPVVVSRMMRDGRVDLPEAETRLALGDLVHAVGEDKDLERLAVLCGERSQVDLRGAAARLDARRLIVTRAAIVGKSLAALKVRTLHGVNVTRVLRAGFELVPRQSLRLHFGDTLVAVGDEERLRDLEGLVGNSIGELEHAQLVPLFVGLAAGVLLGSLPLSFAGVPVPVRLGLAGGPLLVALVLSHFGRLGRMSFYLPNSASLMLRELGIVLFLGSVGLLSGESFVDALARGPGLRWMAIAAGVTLLPLLVAEVFARVVLGLDYTAISGVIAGGMTSPSTLAYANESAGEGVTTAYGAVYPLTMILRIVTAQLLVVFWAG